jgi:hypothetical protein
MSTVQEIEAAIAKLKPAEVKKVAAWINNHRPATAPTGRLNHLRQARGIWKNRKDLPNLRALRRQFDRF